LVTAERGGVVGVIRVTADSGRKREIRDTTRAARELIIKIVSSKVQNIPQDATFAAEGGVRAKITVFMRRRQNGFGFAGSKNKQNPKREYVKRNFHFFVSKILNFFQKLCSNQNIFFMLANQRKMMIIKL